MARNKNRQFVRAAASIKAIQARDPREQQKRERQRQLRPQLRSRQQPSAEHSDAQSLREQLQGPIHPWWQHLPAEQRTRQHQLRIRRRRLLAWLKRKPQRIGLTVITYVLLCGLPLLSGLPLISLVALLPLLLVPPVGVLVSWLVWQEFHA